MAVAAEDQRATGWTASWRTRTPTLSRSRLRQLIDAGAVTATAGPARAARRVRSGDPNHRVKPGETYVTLVPPPVPPPPLGQDIPLAVVYEDKDLIVIDTTGGAVVHPAREIRTARCVKRR